MKSLSLFLVACSFCNAGQQVAMQKQVQPEAPTIIYGETDPDRGPEVLKIFSSMLLPGMLNMAEGHSMENEQQEKAGFFQFAKGAAAFASFIFSEITRNPGVNSLLNEELLTASLKKALASKEGIEFLTTWKKYLHNKDKEQNQALIIAE